MLIFIAYRQQTINRVLNRHNEKIWLEPVGIRPQFRLLEKNIQIVCTETDMACFDWLLFTTKYGSNLSQITRRM